MASSAAGPYGNYSTEIPVEKLRRCVEAAGERLRALAVGVHHERQLVAGGVQPLALGDRIHPELVQDHWCRINSFCGRFSARVRWASQVTTWLTSSTDTDPSWTRCTSLGPRCHFGVQGQADVRHLEQRPIVRGLGHEVGAPRVQVQDDVEPRGRGQRPRMRGSWRAGSSRLTEGIADQVVPKAARTSLSTSSITVLAWSRTPDIQKKPWIMPS